MSLLTELAAQHDAKQAQSAARRAARTTAARGPAAATDPERCRSVGRTLARPAWWPDEEPAWTDPEPAAPVHAPSHKPTRGKRSGGVCSVCHERRSRTGVCWCGQTATPPAPRPRRSHTARDLPPEAQGPAWAQVHRRLHPAPVAACRRCEVAHEPAAS